MYGLVNHGIETFVTEKFSEETWRKIRDSAGVAHRKYEQILTYPDDETYKLVAAISEAIDMPVKEVLEVFGEYWAGYAKDTSIGRLMQLGGKDFGELLESLDEMHARMKMSLPYLDPPRFICRTLGPDLYNLTYISDRPGLAPLAEGLLHGIAGELGCRIAVTRIGPSEETGGKVVHFEIRVLELESPLPG